MEAAASGRVTPIKETFSAWIDHMPGTSPKLIVVGEVSCPSEGCSVALERAEPQGAVSTVILLDLIVVEPEGKEPGKQGVKVKVRYEESPPKENYTKAQIRYGSDSFTIDVGETH